MYRKKTKKTTTRLEGRRRKLVRMNQQRRERKHQLHQERR